MGGGLGGKEEAGVGALSRHRDLACGLDPCPLREGLTVRRREGKAGAFSPRKTCLPRAGLFYDRDCGGRGWGPGGVDFAGA